MAETEWRDAKIGWPNWTQLALVALVALVTLVTLDIRIEFLLRDFGKPPLDVATWYEEVDDVGPSGWHHVSHVEPGGALAKAGIRAGDLFRFSDPLQDAEIDYVGKKVDVTVDRNGVLSRRLVVVQARPTGEPEATPALLSVLNFIQSLAELGFGLLILWRRWGNAAAMCLGLLFLDIGAYVGTVPFWLDNQTLKYLVVSLVIPASFVIGLIPLFVFFLSSDPVNRAERRLVWGWFWISAVLSAVSAYGQLTYTRLPLFGFYNPTELLFAASVAIAVVLLFRNYPNNSRQQRNRIKFVGSAFFIIMLAGLLYFAGGRLLAEQQMSAVLWAGLLLRIAALTLLTYAMIRHRLFDFGFAINRTLVYGTVSFTMLAGFGLAEWSVDGVLPESWHEGSAFFSAAIAVGLFLSFHRLRDWIENHVERLFFSSWHRAEAALRRFVESAGHFDRTETLCKAFAEHVSQFAQGAATALYLRGSDRVYRLQAGALPGARQEYPDDDHAFALMRSERRPVNLAATNRELPGELALPMLDQGTLIGFMLVSLKPDDARYRPDEVQNLGWAAHQLGLDIQALHARDLEERVRVLTEKNAALSENQDRLLAVLERSQSGKGES